MNDTEIVHLKPNKLHKLYFDLQPFFLAYRFSRREEFKLKKLGIFPIVTLDHRPWGSILKISRLLFHHTLGIILEVQPSDLISISNRTIILSFCSLFMYPHTSSSCSSAPELSQMFVCSFERNVRIFPFLLHQTE